MCVCALTFPQRERSLTKRCCWPVEDNGQIAYGKVNACWSGDVSGAVTCSGGVSAAVNALKAFHYILNLS